MASDPGPPPISHLVTCVEDGGRFTAHCACGWQSEPLLRLPNATAWGSAHVAERRSAAWLIHAMAWRATAEQQREAAVQQRGTTLERRTSLRRERQAIQQRLASVRSVGVRRNVRPLDEPAKLRRAAARLESAREMADLTMDELWMCYFGVGGKLPLATLELVLTGVVALSVTDHDLLALVLNEHFVDQGMGRPLDYWTGPAF